MREPKGKARNVIAWVLQILLALDFLLAGQAKFSSSELWSGNFERWGYPDQFYMVIGAIELLAALALLFPKFSSYAALVLSVIMLGAGITHFSHGENGIAPIVILTLLLVVAFLRKDKAVKLTRLKST